MSDHDTKMRGTIKEKKEEQGKSRKKKNRKKIRHDDDDDDDDDDADFSARSNVYRVLTYETLRL